VARYWALAGSILALLLTAYLLVEALGVELLADPRSRLSEGGLAGAGSVSACSLRTSSCRCRRAS
jgi:hypothetical protein